jgi:hypothetical protein
MLFIRKRGSNELNAMWLVIMIAVFLVVYIILLPVGEKEKLVGTQPIYGPSSGNYGGYGSGGLLGSGLLLSESPGIVYPLVDAVIGKPLASVNLFSYTDVVSEGLANSVTVKNGLFTSQDKTLTFVVPNAPLQDVQLLFLVKESEGNLILELNGEEIYNDEVTVEDLPLSLPAALLKPTNTLEISVGNADANIFKTNYYELKDVQIFYKIAQENKREVRTFTLTKSELASLSHMTLFYVVNCFTVDEDGRLAIILNGNVISDSLIVCDAGPIALDLDPSDLVPGTNVLQFEIDQGKYVLEQIVLEKEVGEEEAPRYVFTMQVADFKAITAGADVVLDLTFTHDNTRKIGAVYVNGYPVYFDTYDYRFTYDISGLVGPGTNVLRIIPKIPVDIVSLKVGFA